MTLELNHVVPDFLLPSHLGEQVRLSDYRGKHLVLAFFPQAWTPV